MNYKNLYFDDTNNYLSTIGIVVKVNNAAVKGATGFTDIGGSPSTIDATKLTDTVTVTVPGVKQMSEFGITYLFNNNQSSSDFRVLQGHLANPSTAVTIKVEFPDGTVASNSGLPASNVISGGSVGAMLSATASYTLQGDWTFTDPT